MIVEIIICMLYIYAIMIVSILVNPTPLVLILFGIYTFVFTRLIYKKGKCKHHNQFQIFSVAFSLLAMAFFYMVHFIYHDYPKYKVLLLFCPFIYVFILKQFDKSFTHKNKCTINCALDFVNIKINNWM
jgi:hypothetical protein